MKQSLFVCLKKHHIEIMCIDERILKVYDVFIRKKVESLSYSDIIIEKTVIGMKKLHEVKK